MKYRALSWQSLTLTAVIALVASALFAFSRPAVMMVDGERVDSDVPPVTASADKVFVPLRSIADALGADVVVDEKTGTIAIVRGTQSLRIRVGDEHATFNGMPLTLRHAPFRVRGRVMVSLRTVELAFGVRATYDPRTARIDVVTTGVGRAGSPATPAVTQ